MPRNRNTIPARAKAPQKTVQKTARSLPSPDRAVEQAIESIAALRGIYIRETDALNATDTKSFLALQDEKLEAARSYGERIETLLARREDMKAVNPILKKRLEEMRSDFAILSRKNKEALERMQRCTRRLDATLRRAAKETLQKNLSFNYGENGALKGHARKTISTGGINETA
jgi:hypothetical protein